MTTRIMAPVSPFTVESRSLRLSAPGQSQPRLPQRLPLQSGRCASGSPGSARAANLAAKSRESMGTLETENVNRARIVKPAAKSVKPNPKGA